MILPRPKSELRLEKELLPGTTTPLCSAAATALSDGCLVVVPALVSGIDTAESHSQGETQ